MILAALRTPDIVVLFVYFALLIGAGADVNKARTDDGCTLVSSPLTKERWMSDAFSSTPERI